MAPTGAAADSESAEVLVAVLGPVTVLGAARPLRRARALELVAYLAMHPHGVSSDAWATALWPDRTMAPPTLHSTCSAARRSLGPSRSGHDHLPRSRGRLRLGPTVGTDWRRFTDLASTNDPGAWQRAMGLVRGRPFEDLSHADWTILEGFVSEMEEGIVDLSLRLAEHRLCSGEPARAARAARQGLRASPFDERLYRVLLRAADAQGHPAGVESVMGELGRLLNPEGAAPLDADGRGPLVVGGAERIDPPDLVHPDTAALYRALSRRQAARRPRSGRASGGVVTRL